MKTELKNSLETLKANKVLLYPTDTIWGLGCDATDIKAVSKIYTIKKREESKSLIVLVDSLDMLKDYVEKIPVKALKVLKTAQKPTTIIYKTPKGLAKNIIAKDNTVAIRIVQDEFCKKLIKKLRKPIVSTSANISDENTPMSFKEIEPVILNAVDYVVNLRQNETAKQSSRIIRILDNDDVEVLRN